MSRLFEQSLIVAKFGGTSVQTREAIESIATIALENPHLRAIVVSAVSGVTNQLVRFCKESHNRLSIQDDLLNIHKSMCADLEIESSFLSKITPRLEPYQKASHLSFQEVDDVLSLGEDLSSHMVGLFLKKKGLDFHVQDVRDFMITDDLFTKATPIPSLIQERITPLQESGVRFITQGFVGRTSKGFTTTLGRGGSDYSAALIAEALGADELHIYTDVLGVYTMDPNIVKSSSLIEKLSFQEMAEMANFGAKIVHPATLEPCIRSGVPVRILSTLEPNKGGTYICIGDQEEGDHPLVRSITIRKNQVLVTIKSLKMLDTYGFLSHIFSILSQHKISVDLITTSEVSVALTVDRLSLGSCASNPFDDPLVRRDLETVAEILIEDHLALVAVVGTNLTSPGMIQKIVSNLDQTQLRLICYGASHSSIGLLVKESECERIATMLHYKLLEEEKINV